MRDKKISPSPEEIREAKQHANGWIYRIEGNYDSNAEIPPHAIIGAWRVDEDGLICGDFIVNPKNKNKQGQS